MFLALTLLASALQSSAAQPASQLPARTIHIDAGKFSFETPAGFKDITSEVVAILARRRTEEEANGSAKPNCLQVLYEGDKVTDAASVHMELSRLDMTCLKTQPTDAYLKGFMERNARRSIKEPTDQLQPAQLYTLSIHRAVAIAGKLTSGTRPTRFVRSCVVSEGDVYCWNISVAGAATAGDLGFVRITFEGGTPMPLLPAALTE